jgi:PPOX class probable FMN-dependent enzyme
MESSENPLAPWRSPLARAIHRNRALPYSRYFQLATVDIQGRPANRTVVFRGFIDGRNALKIITDTRTQKYEQIQQNPWAAICWYFPKTREQFRLSGALVGVDRHTLQVADESVYRHTWEALSDSARQQFYWPKPGEPRLQEDIDLPALETLEYPADCYALLILTPDSVDHLVLQGYPHQRHHYRCDAAGKWQTTWVMP